MRRLVLVALLTTVAACAPKTIPPPVVVTSSPPKFPDFVVPAVPESFTGSPSAASLARGWQLLQAGDLKSADREFDSALKLTSGFYPAEAGLG
jgi:hypothetical protein